jgi:hypothetical protein
MARSLFGMFSRVAFFACGMISVLLSNGYRALQRVDPDMHSRLPLFSTALIVIGGFSAVLALLPTSWVAWASKTPTNQNVFSVPIKMVGALAVFSYLLTLGLYFAPKTLSHFPLFVIFSACPACVLSVTVDASFGTVLLLLAPLSAAVYGSLGAILGFVLVAIRNRS